MEETSSDGEEGQYDTDDTIHPLVNDDVSGNIAVFMLS